MNNKLKNLLIGAAAAGAVTYTAVTFTSTTSKRYYFASNGSDNNSGTSPTSPLKTISKLNTLLASSSEDSFFLNKGDVFYGSIKFGSNKDILTSYGTGEKPIVTTMANVTNWTYLGNNIYESVSPVSSAVMLKMVTKNGTPLGKARWPNEGWSTIKSHYAKSYITDDGLPSNITVQTGGEIVMKTERWTMDIGNLTKRSGNSLYYTYVNSKSYEPTNNYGYFIQNLPSCLDKDGEWVYMTSTKKIRVFSSSGAPTGIAVATSDNLVNSNARDGIQILGISFIGSNSDAILVAGGSSHFSIDNCNVSNGGRDGINVQYTTSTDFEAIANSITNSNNIGIETNSEYRNTLMNNTVKNSGLINGLADPSEGNMGSGISMRHVTDQYFVRGNRVLNSSFQGIAFKNDAGLASSNNIDISNNLIDSFCLRKDDGAGIATWSGSTNPPMYKNRNIYGNVILHGIGSKDGVPSTTVSVYGFYADYGASDINFRDNIVAFCGRTGFFVNYADKRINVYNNLFFHNGYGMGTDTRGCQVFINSQDARPVSSISIKKNIFWATGTEGIITVANYNSSTITKFGISDSNHIIAFNTKTTPFTWWLKSLTKETIAQWRSRGYDKNSDTMLVSATTPIMFDYAFNTSKVISLGTDTYLDAMKKPYTGDITITPSKAFIGRKK